MSKAERIQRMEILLHNGRPLSESAEALLTRALRDSAYGIDVESWIDSHNSIRSAEGNFIAGLVHQYEDPERVRDYFEEARRKFIDMNWLEEASVTCKLLALVYECDFGDLEAGRLHTELAAEYLEEARKHPRLEPPVFDFGD